MPKLLTKNFLKNFLAQQHPAQFYAEIFLGFGRGKVFVLKLFLQICVDDYFGDTTNLVHFFNFDGLLVHFQIYLPVMYFLLLKRSSLAESPSGTFFQCPRSCVKLLKLLWRCRKW